MQSALLEAMEERQVTLGGETFRLDEPFLVLATQNPIEQEGTYPLPEAQLDRFLLKLKVPYPSPGEEVEILRRMGDEEPIRVEKLLGPQDLLRLQEAARARAGGQPPRGVHRGAGRGHPRRWPRSRGAAERRSHPRRGEPSAALATWSTAPPRAPPSACTAAPG